MRRMPPIGISGLLVGRSDALVSLNKPVAHRLQIAYVR